MIFESHAHYDDDKFNEDRDAVIRDALDHGIGRIINVAASIESVKTSLELAEKYEEVYAAVGVHPSEIDGLKEESLLWIKEMAGHKKAVAIGEIGLDYYWEKDKTVQEEQRMWFQRQLDLAKELSLPVIIHSRDAAEDTLRILKDERNQGIDGVIHCYSYSKEMAEEFLKLGFYIGVGGVVTFKNAKKLVETVEAVPMERILLETDCPYMAPEPHRGKRNDSRYIPYVVETIARIKQLTTQEVEDQAWANAMKLFHKVQ